jgi:membrane-bound metal-dependent hydrolase YbcI (DUF457 family)
MITRHHLILTMACTILVGSVLLPSEPVGIGAAVAGALAGAILPDFQMRRPKRPGLLTGAWLISRFTWRICIPAMQSVYSMLHIRSPDREDKRLTHSLPGIGFIFIAAAGIILIPVFVTGNGRLFSLSLVLLSGLLFGLGLHLVEDLCTMKGISPLFPFDACTISGSIRPCNAADTRIARFQAQHGMTVGIFFTLHATGLLPAPILLSTCIIGLCALLGWMIHLSRVKATVPGRRPEHHRAAILVSPSLSLRIIP